MKKLVLVNSFGPMASTVIAGLLEKMKFTNVPLRKLDLHKYLMGKTALNSGLMESRLKRSMLDHAQPGLRGGVSVLDRNNQTAKSLLQADAGKNIPDHITADSVQDLYFKCRNTYCDSVIYKKMESSPDRQIEMTTDIHRYDHMALYNAYQKHFDDVRMIHLHRPFKGWINSLASQAFLHPELKNRIQFFPHMRHADYALYEEAVNVMPGLHIEFDEIFNTPIEELTAKICTFLDVEIPSCNLRKESFDLYGKITPYEKTFTKFDDKITYLQPGTLQYFSKLAESGQIKKKGSALTAWIRYLCDMLSYRAKNAA